MAASYQVEVEAQITEALFPRSLGMQAHVTACYG